MDATQSCLHVLLALVFGAGIIRLYQTAVRNRQRANGVPPTPTAALPTAVVVTRAKEEP